MPKLARRRTGWQKRPDRQPQNLDLQEQIEEENKMGTMPIGKLLMNMAWPAILSMTINAMYNVVDSIFVSRLNEDALTAVSLVNPIQLMIVALSVGSGVGINSLIARRLGAKNQEAADKAASTRHKDRTVQLPDLSCDRRIFYGNVHIRLCRKRHLYFHISM